MTKTNSRVEKQCAETKKRYQRLQTELRLKKFALVAELGKLPLPYQKVVLHKLDAALDLYRNPER